MLRLERVKNIKGKCIARAMAGLLITKTSEFQDLEQKLMVTVLQVVEQYKMQIRESGDDRNPYLEIVQEGNVVAFIDYKHLLPESEPAANIITYAHMDPLAKSLENAVMETLHRKVTHSYASVKTELSKPAPYKSAPKNALI
jgi:hypothetical protein